MSRRQRIITFTCSVIPIYEIDEATAMPYRIHHHTSSVTTSSPGDAGKLYFNELECNTRGIHDANTGPGLGDTIFRRTKDTLLYMHLSLESIRGVWLCR
jgi:hypothetical protein